MRRRHRVLGLSAGCIAMLVVIGYVAVQFMFRDPLNSYGEYQGHVAGVYSVDYEPSKRWVASGGEDGLRLWQLDDQKEIFNRPGRVHAVKFLPDNRLLCADSNEGLLLLRTTDWTVDQRLGGPAFVIVSDVSPDGIWLAASFSVVPKSDDERPSSYDIHVWQLDRTTSEEFVLSGHEGSVSSLAFHPTLAQLVSCSQDATVRVWDVEMGNQIAQRGKPLFRPWLKLAQARSDCAFNPGGTELLTGQHVSPYPKIEQAKPLAADLPFTYASAYSPDGKWIATGHKDGTVRLWDTSTHQQVDAFSAFVNGTAVFAIRFSSDSRFLITAGDGIVPGFDALHRGVTPDDTTVRVWRVRDYRPR